MTSKLYFLITLLFLFVGYSCTECKGDQYGTRLELELPVTTSLSSDTISTDDTIQINIVTDKEVAIYDSDQTIFLEDFNFFSEIILSEISGTEEDFNVNIELNATEGSTEELPLSNSISYPIFSFESEGQYRFSASLRILDPGIYFLSYNSDFQLFERYEHPAMYRCEDERRSEITVSFNNQETSEEEFVSVFQQSDIDYFTTIYDYERYARLGARTFVVTEP